MNLFKNLVDIDRVGFFSSTFLFFFTFWSCWTFAGFGDSFFWTFWGCLSFWRHNECISIENDEWIWELTCVCFFAYIDHVSDNFISPIEIEFARFHIGRFEPLHRRRKEKKEKVHVCTHRLTSILYFILIYNRRRKRKRLCFCYLIIIRMRP